MYDNQQAFFEALKKGDNEAYTQLLKETKGFCMNYARHDENARDVMQDTFIEFMRLVEIGRYVFINGKVSSYFNTIFRHRWIDYLRRNARNGSELPDLPDPEPDEPGPDMSSTVRRAIGQLGKKCQERLILNYINGLKLNEIAEKMNVAHGTMRNQLMDCRNELRQLFGNNNGESFDESTFDNLLKVIAQKYIDDNTPNP
jgi:RNA polymerase sigma factor (sigma-70 family)